MEADVGRKNSYVITNFNSTILIKQLILTINVVYCKCCLRMIIYIAEPHCLGVYNEISEKTVKLFLKPSLSIHFLNNYNLKNNYTQFTQ